MENKHKQLDPNNYHFFVRNAPLFNPNNGLKNDYESYMIGGADRKNCRLVDWSPRKIESFVRRESQIYKHIECVQVPENAKYSLEEINSMLGKQPVELTKEEKLEQRIAELEAKLNNTVSEPKTKLTRKPKA